ncbi:MAG: sulfatase [Cyclobacteriaceae bacterium]|nr:sulfatase [Cyclobacteriaceae bacterium]
MVYSKKFLFTGILAVIVSAAFTSCSHRNAEKVKNPNILFIMVDDLRPDLNCYGSNHISSPNIDKLASEGILFKQAYVQQAICMASRASLLTGYRPHENRIYSCLSVQELMPGVETLNQFFENNGYKVMAKGKIFHHHEDHVEQFGDEWLPTDKHEKPLGRGYLTPTAIAEMDESGRGPAWEIADVEDYEYRDGYYGLWAAEQIEKLKDSDAPFFLGVGFYKPHLPFNAPRKYWDIYDHDAISLTSQPEYPENGSVYGLHSFGELRNYTNIPKGNEPIPDDMARMLIHGYYACISYIDAQIGIIMDALEKSGLKENTIVVLMGDHGWKLGDHSMWAKHTNFELDTRVPLIITGPGVQQNQETHSFAEYIDLYPTLADLAGLQAPAHVQGLSLVPVLQNPEKSVKDAAFSIWPSYRGSRTDDDKVIMGYSVRTDEFRYTEWIHMASDSLLDRELYDHRYNHREEANIVKDPTVADHLPALEQRIYNYRKAAVKP